MVNRAEGAKNFGVQVGAGGREGVYLPHGPRFGAKKIINRSAHDIHLLLPTASIRRNWSQNPYPILEIALSKGGVFDMFLDCVNKKYQIINY